ncbi:flagellar hook-length control protein [Clostridium zeae]|uniref:Flagellar hook-length control protein n=1 Tax=Clostridium zeae TaxID=2759022 RepID=A0ABQ1E849_9CLOT|nr:flagellar hook-length control protein FliK [Clostridium zeae]GFZ30965.1 flagellar hook-length control protein [Clostridium zeae]
MNISGVNNVLDLMQVNTSSQSNQAVNSKNESNQSDSKFSSILSKTAANKNDIKNNDVVDKSDDNKLDNTLSELKQIKEQLDNKGDSLQKQVSEIFPKEKTEVIDSIVDSIKQIIKEVSEGDKDINNLLGAPTNNTQDKTDVDNSNFQGNNQTDKDNVENDIDKLVAILTMFLMGNNTQVNNETTADATTSNNAKGSDSEGVLSIKEALSNVKLMDLAVKDFANKGQNIDSEASVQAKSSSIVTEIMSLLEKVDDSQTQGAIQLDSKTKENLQNLIETVVNDKPQEEKSLKTNADTKDVKQVILDLINIKNNVKESDLQKDGTNKDKVSANVNNLYVAANRFRTNESNVTVDNSTKKLTSDSNDGDKLLKSIIGDKDNNVQSKFSMMVDQIKNNTQAVATPNEQPVINKNTMINDIVKSIKYMEKLDVKELTLKTNPGNLGEITIKLTLDTNTMKATLTANTKEAYGLLNDNLKELQKSLSSNGIKIPEVAIELRNDNYNNPNRDPNSQAANFGFGSEQKENRNQGNSSRGGSNSSDDEISIEDNTRQATINNNLNYLV